ncbi:hypothetical protein ACFWXM_00935 [Achromobacter xylosoxidans]|uniref:hypothetical protein n=1 Tax=Alcaligenes xylosoxydans xylosoxydans TaxID=85698 RepID=UPI00375A5F28
MSNMSIPTPCGTAAILRVYNDEERRAELMRDLGGDVHLALGRDQLIHREYDFSQRAAEALYAATEGNQLAEDAFALVARSVVARDPLAVVGLLFRQWFDLAIRQLTADLADRCEDGQRVTFGARQ